MVYLQKLEILKLLFVPELDEIGRFIFKVGIGLCRVV